jgi:biopolymer transport protein ExbB/TolQ
MDFTLVEMWAQMGVIAKLVVIALVVMSIVTVAVTVERILYYRRADQQSQVFAQALGGLLQSGKFQEAADSASQHPHSHIAPVIRAGVKEFLEARALSGKGNFDLHAAVKNAMDRTVERQMATLRKGLSSLATIGSTAPFVGLFGTTFGIINSFQGMAKEGGGGLGSVAAGIAEALITTAVGIGVAIAAVLIYNYFTAKVEGLEVDTHEAAGEVIATLAKAQAKAA